MTLDNNAIQPLEQAYGFRVVRVTQMKTVTGIETSHGRYIWKPIQARDTEARLSSIAKVLELLADRGIQTAAPLPNRQGQFRTACGPHSVGYLQPWIDGDTLNVSNRHERITAFQTLAHMHNATGGIPLNSVVSQGNLPSRLKTKSGAFNALWSRVRPYDKLRDMEMPLFQHLSAALDCYQTWHTRHYALTPRHRRAVFCHRDLAPHNLLWNASRQQISFIDFDLSGMDDPLADVLQLTGHTAWLTPVKQGDYLEIVRVYAERFELSEEREWLLWQLLRFPDLFIRTLGEWARIGFSPDHLAKVDEAIEKECLRWEVWRDDYLTWLGKDNDERTQVGNAEIEE